MIFHADADKEGLVDCFHIKLIELCQPFLEPPFVNGAYLLQ